ncbi:CRISPR-associated protein Csx16 [Stappia sp. ES.058]|uniref:CRISPR-associated protein Csx16 n=1 Tax=Stappia sp. ES.058 TaxID=1881061 RepID=UPI000879D2C6|nr:CRISPR-associated protein Csx16 [Stappia sp. ES.058]SDU13828.1 putative CRISPR-associated protein, VVA1548 family [Stappia sp. ES.058]
MTGYFVTRHQGARECAEQEGLGEVRLVSHLDPETLGPGDTVLGTLPVQLVAAVNARPRATPTSPRPPRRKWPQRAPGAFLQDFGGKAIDDRDGFLEAEGFTTCNWRPACEALAYHACCCSKSTGDSIPFLPYLRFGL